MAAAIRFSGREKFPTRVQAFSHRANVFCDYSDRQAPFCHTSKRLSITLCRLGQPGIGLAHLPISTRQPRQGFKLLNPWPATPRPEGRVSSAE
jgi:hypothetical protein